MHTNRFVAFLRGINVGGNTKVKMEELRSVFEELGFTNVKTLLNSGNVIFEGPDIDLDKLREKIEELLEKKFGRKIGVLLRTSEQIRKLVSSDPFNNIHLTPEIRLYITFLSEKPISTLKIPYNSAENDIRILSVSGEDVVSVITLSTQKNTTDLMKIIEKEFGKNVTTRSWNTILRIGKISL